MSTTTRQRQPWDDPGNGCFVPYRANLAGLPGAEVIDELKATDNDYIIPKHRKSAFFQTKLELSLRARGIDTIVLCGSAIASGIAATVYSAQDHVDTVFPRIGRVRTTDQVLEMMSLGASVTA